MWSGWYYERILFFPPLTADIWVSLYALENNELLTTQWWESDVWCWEGPAGSALWDTALSTKVFLGTGADCQPGSICSSDCLGNVSNASQNGRFVREWDRASCWAMAITDLRLNVSYCYLHAEVSENAALDTTFLITCPCSAGNSDRHMPMARGFFLLQLCWALFPVPPAVSEESWSPSGLFLFFSFYLQNIRVFSHFLFLNGI